MPRESKTIYSILSVDDDAEMLGLLHEVVNQLGHHSATAVDGQDALQKLREKDFDIVITDISMTKMNGLELTKKIKADFERDGIACEVHASVSYQSPGEDLVNFAKENQVDEIIIGVRRRSKVGKLVFGSTAQYVILEAPCPVLSVK